MHGNRTVLTLFICSERCSCIRCMKLWRKQWQKESNWWFSLKYQVAKIVVFSFEIKLIKEKLKRDYSASNTRHVQSVNRLEIIVFRSDPSVENFDYYSKIFLTNSDQFWSESSEVVRVNGGIHPIKYNSQSHGRWAPKNYTTCVLFLLAGNENREAMHFDSWEQHITYSRLIMRFTLCWYVSIVSEQEKFINLSMKLESLSFWVKLILILCLNPIILMTVRYFSLTTYHILMRDTNLSN